MTATEVLAQLQKFGSAQTKKTFLRHGAKEPFFGVKVGDLKTLQKKLKTNQPLALELYASGNSDAMYLAGLIADPQQFTEDELRTWAKGAYWYMLSRHVVPWVASESRFGRKLALEWMGDASEMIANAGWSTYSSLTSITPDAELDLAEIETLLDRVKDEIDGAQNQVKYAMNAFIIAVGCFVVPLNAKAKRTAKALGTVEVDMGDTSCEVPDAAAYIAKVEAAGRLGKKRKRAAC